MLLRYFCYFLLLSFFFSFIFDCASGASSSFAFGLKRLWSKGAFAQKKMLLAAGVYACNESFLCIHNCIRETFSVASILGLTQFLHRCKVKLELWFDTINYFNKQTTIKTEKEKSLLFCSCEIHLLLICLYIRRSTHYGSVKPRIETKALGHLLVRLLLRSRRSLIHLLCTVCFARSLRCAHSSTSSLAHSLPSLKIRMFRTIRRTDEPRY